VDAAAKERLVVGKIEDAQKSAQKLMTLLPKLQGDWNYGNAVQAANLVLGRIAVREGGIDDAKLYLLRARLKNPGVRFGTKLDRGLGWSGEKKVGEGLDIGR
jgi:hypothetical protein